MTKKQALSSLFYWVHRLSYNEDAEIMAKKWVRAIENGKYKKLPEDSDEADAILEQEEG